MKSILLSIKPKYVELIVNEEKTVEVRKTRPKIETPFKCYIYMTRFKWIFNILRKLCLEELAEKLEHSFGKVVGEFVCDEVADFIPYSTSANDIGYYSSSNAIEKTCLSNEELLNYGKGEPLYGWLISELKIYDKPRDIGEFIGSCIRPNGDTCWGCRRYNQTYGFCKCKLTRPPQSFCYVEEL